MKKKVLRLASIFSIMILCKTATAQYFCNSGSFDTTRIQHAMAKARSGGELTLAYLGGSITAGTAASSEKTRWVNLVTDWWKTKFPNASFTLVNAGYGGTGSDIGTFRVKNDVLSHNPDFVVVEFAVNDSYGDYATEMMENIVRQVLTDENKPGLMMLMLKQSNGTTSQESHKKVGNHYLVPMVSFADRIDAAVQADGVSLSSIYSDGLHPLDCGMRYIATFITEALEQIYSTLPASNQIAQVSDTLPEPLISNDFTNTFSYNSSNLIPIANDGWTASSNGWTAEKEGAEMVFELDGNAVAVQYYRHNWSDAGKAQIWIDDEQPVTLNAYWSDTWGPGTCFQLLQRNLPDGKHKLHIKAENYKGCRFVLRNILKAGNISGAAPIAKIAQTSYKVKMGSTLELDGSASYNPDGSTNLTYSWSISAAPDGNTATIANADKSKVEFTPNVAGKYVVNLTVSNADWSSIVAQAIIISVGDNTKPVAAITANKDFVKISRYAVFSGSDSYDADGDGLTYEWTLISKPEGSATELSFSGDAATIKCDVEGEYKVQLVVNDSLDKSEPATAIVTANATGTATDIKDGKVLEMSIIPNPSDGNCRITFPSDGKTSITIYNTESKKLIHRILPEGETEFLLCGELKSGQYIIDVSNNLLNQLKMLIIK